MTDIGPQDVLFMGMGRTHVAWYRCFLPALALQADWIGYGTPPPEIRSATGFVRGDLQEPNYEDYKVIVVQQPRGKNWLDWMAGLHDKGVKILYEIDDNLPAVAKMKSHHNRNKIRSHLGQHEQFMRMCDGIIVSTKELASKVKRFNKNVWVCEVGIDMERYQLERPAHDDFTIGFAGGFGHEISLFPWLSAINDVMEYKDNVRFMSVGVDYTEHVTRGEKVHLPFTQVESWPSVMSNFDILLAPGADHPFFKCKSELKWIEASAMGIPVIANPIPYKSIRHTFTGWRAETPLQVRSWLRMAMDHRDLTAEMAQRAREEVLERYHIRNQVEQWIKVFEEVT